MAVNNLQPERGFFEDNLRPMEELNIVQDQYNPPNTGPVADGNYEGFLRSYRAAGKEKKIRSLRMLTARQRRLILERLSSFVNHVY